MPAKIVHVNTARGFRGGERQTELLITGLKSCNVQQALIARRGGPLAARVRRLDVEVREVAGGVWSVTRATRDASLIHVHEGRSVYAAYLRSLLSGIRDHWFAHKAYVRAACVAAVAPQVADIVRAYDSQIPVRVVHSGSSGLTIDPNRTAMIRAEHPGQLLVGHVGALDNGQKGQEDEAKLKAAAAGLSNLTFVGFVNNVGDFLGAFDIFILPSNREGIGSILLDAMEQGLPVVASRVGGVPDIVHHGENGLLIDPASPAQLRDAILTLRADEALRRTYGERGRAFAKDFTAEAMWRKYLTLYESLLGPLG
jgi:glycosyltransferase involved in cell wall biosynthesis